MGVMAWMAVQTIEELLDKKVDDGVRLKTAKYILKMAEITEKRKVGKGNGKKARALEQAKGSPLPIEAEVEKVLYDIVMSKEGRELLAG